MELIRRGQVSEPSKCAVCGRTTSTGIVSWHLVCPNCGYEASTLQASIPTDPTVGQLDEDLRAAALQSLRRRNFQRLLESVTAQVSGGSLLDVGSAHGWFLELASATYSVTGIEPDRRTVDSLADMPWPVIRGYFPGDVPPGRRFDVITFNDTLEHIADIRGALEACRKSLNTDGVLALALPSTSGAIYRTSKLLCRLGVRSPFARMWQKGLPSPHLHYIRLSNLRMLLSSCGFEVAEAGALRSISVEGLRERIAFTGGVGAIAQWLYFMGFVAATPLLRALPSDAIYVIARPRTP